jgi:hypothetical protein
MPSRRDEIRAELAELLQEGSVIAAKELVAKGSSELRAALVEELSRHRSRRAQPDESSEAAAAGENRAGEDEISAFAFASAYQGWYSRALRVVEQLLPERYDEFRELYLPTKRKALTASTYSIADYAGGITLTRGMAGVPIHDPLTTALGKFHQQIAILGSAEPLLRSLLRDLKGVLEADLVDDELAAARELLAAKHLRSAGIIAGVVLERHLKRVLANHRITLRKKPMLANLNQALKDAAVYGTTEWRKLQHLTDVRNLCGHDAEREPTREEVDDLIRGVAMIVNTVV